MDQKQQHQSISEEEYERYPCKCITGCCLSFIQMSVLLTLIGGIVFSSLFIEHGDYSPYINAGFGMLIGFFCMLICLVFKWLARYNSDTQDKMHNIYRQKQQLGENDEQPNYV